MGKISFRRIESATMSAAGMFMDILCAAFDDKIKDSDRADEFSKALDRCNARMMFNNLSRADMLWCFENLRRKAEAHEHIIRMNEQSEFSFRRSLDNNQ